MHVFTTNLQPATNYLCDAGIRIHFKERTLIRPGCCFRKRWAKNLMVQSYYDGDRFYCKDGKGCNKGKK